MTFGINQVTSPLSQDSSVVHQATRTLSNADILGWPTTAIEMVGAPGANRLVMPVSSLAVFHLAVAYDGVADTVKFRVYVGNGLSTGYSVDAAWMLTDTTEQNFVWLQPVTYVTIPNLEESTAVAGEASVLEGGGSATVNLPMTMGLSQGGLTPGMTGGDDANQVITYHEFRVLNLSTGRFMTVAESGWNESTRQFYLPSYPQPT